MTKKKGTSPERQWLSNGIPISRVLHDDLFKHAAAHIRTLTYGVRYESKDLVGPRYWADNPEWHWHIGCCIADWERKRLLPLRFLGCPLCKVRYYERT